jgi:cobalamin biosynthesis Mg chelatase CobN
MGTNVSKSISTINQEIAQTLSQESTASANADCAVKTGKIILKNADGCSVKNHNFCSATAGAAIDTTVDAAVKAFNDATKEQKAAVLPGINANSTQQEIKTAIRSTLEQKCGAKSDVRNNIITDDIIIEGCKNSTIDNINTGDAAATCGVRAVMKATTDAANIEKTSQETTGLNLFGGAGSIVIIIVIILVLIGLGVILWIFMGKSAQPSASTVNISTMSAPPYGAGRVPQMRSFRKFR